MLMLRMRRTLCALVILAAALIAVEPVVHTHPLTQSDAAAQCALCVNAHAGVTTLKPASVSPLVMVGSIVIASSPVDSAASDLALPSRAPPAA